MEEIGKFSTASLITRSTNDIQQVLMFIVMGLQMLIKAPITAIWAICKISGQEWQWSLATALGVIIVVVVVITCISLVLPKVKKMQKFTDDLNRVTRENLDGLRVVRAYNAESYQERKFEQANEQLTQAQLFQQRTMAFMLPTMMTVQSGLMLAIYWLGAALLGGIATPTERIATFGNMMVFSQYGIMIVMAFMMLVMPFMMLPRASVAAKRINEVLDTILTDQVNLSQGQKQQLTIARAMIADKPMLILDEATSSVDTRTELQIQDAMDKLMHGRTSFVIAHRLSTIKNADLILVMKEGDIIESGNHEGLLAKGGFYSELYNSQFEQAS